MLHHCTDDHAGVSDAGANSETTAQLHTVEKRCQSPQAALQHEPDNELQRIAL